MGHCPKSEMVNACACRAVVRVLKAPVCTDDKDNQQRLLTIAHCTVHTSELVAILWPTSSNNPVPRPPSRLPEQGTEGL
eukprot:15430141-Alexandrium_andersonii.AAC.1